MQIKFFLRGIKLVLIVFLIATNFLPNVYGHSEEKTISQGPDFKSATFIDWINLSNPILSFSDRMLKDQAIVYYDGYFYIFSSTRFENNDTNNKNVFYRTQDFKTYEELYDKNIADGGSPDIIKVGGTFFMVFQFSLSSDDSNIRRIFYSTSTNLINWSESKEIAPCLQPYMRHIDGALAYEDGYFYLGYKGWQTFFVTKSVNKELDGNWLRSKWSWAGGPFKWAENYQFIKIDNVWHMIATSKPVFNNIFELLKILLNELSHPYVGNHEPCLYTMDGGGECLNSWARWINKTYLNIPREDWNELMIANSAYLCDWREYDGYFYLFYAGANDWFRFEERGHCKIGVVRSTNLKNWYLSHPTRPFR